MIGLKKNTCHFSYKDIWGVVVDYKEDLLFKACVYKLYV